MPSFAQETPPAATKETVSAQQSSMALPIPKSPSPVSSAPSASRQSIPLHHRPSQASLPAELCEGPLLEEPEPPRTPPGDDVNTCSDRIELIERLKKGQSPTWRPNRNHDSIWSQPPLSPSRTQTPERRPMTPSMLQPLTIAPDRGMPPTQVDESHEAAAKAEYGLSIERPRSALHSGDFTQDDRPSRREHAEPDTYSRHGPDTSQFNHHNPWLATSPPRNFTHFQFERRQSVLGGQHGASALSASLSSSISSSFAYKPPTSPLVQSESNDEIDLPSPLDGIDIGLGSSRSIRRHTLMSTHSGPFNFSQSPSSRHPPGLRQEKSFPYQAHQPRRSLTSTPSFLPLDNAQQIPPFSRSRRPSYGSDASPIQHASMVGSYEESILRGRMSTTPSKPLEFVAQIGVLGLGKCKSSLRCPPHVTLPFPAVFYSYATSAYGRTKTEDGPSPYVGQIDLENGLPNQEGDARTKRKLQSRTAADRKATGEGDEAGDRSNNVAPDREARRGQRQKRRSGSPRAPPGGSYRIPEKGQIQIIIKNPNKTAVKLFLVPYDLAGMEPGTKTFIRQRSYSAGPIIENMPDLPESGSFERPTLRYLVHLHICCPSKGRFYLYKSIRVVFANRVPDGKERLRNEVSTPEPKFSSYKPIRVMHPPITGGSGPAASLAAEKAFRRRSLGYYAGLGPGPSLEAMDAVDVPSVPQSQFSFNFGRSTPVEPIPFSLPRRVGGKVVTEGDDRTSTDLLSQSPGSSRPTTQSSPSDVPWDGPVEKYNKLSPGDAGYGGNAFSGLINGSPAVAESLLSQRLRTLGVQGLEQAGAKSGRDDEDDDAMDRD